MVRRKRKKQAGRDSPFAKADEIQILLSQSSSKAQEPQGLYQAGDSEVAYKDTLVFRAEAADDNEENQEKESETGIEFWSSQSDTVFKLLKPLALDLLAMPASQAFAESVFSVTGDLSTGRRNRARTTLERSAFLKLNKA